MSYREQLDLLLAALLHLRESKGPLWVDLQALAGALGWDNPLDVIEAARFLEGQGYIRADLRIGGAVDAQLAPPGTMYLQDKGTLIEGLLEQAAAALEGRDFAAGKASDHPIQADRRLAFDKIEALRRQIERLSLDPALQDTLEDLETLKRELGRTRPNRDIIDNKLHALSMLALPIGHEMRELVELLSL